MGGAKCGNCGNDGLHACAGGSLMNYDPNMTLSGRHAKQLVSLKFGVWDYRWTIEVEILGNCLGFDVIDAAIGRAYAELPSAEYSSKVARLVLTRPNGDDLYCDDEEQDGEEWLRSMLIGAEITSIEPDAQDCPCKEPACVEPWEPGCGLGVSEGHVSVAGLDDIECHERVANDLVSWASRELADAFAYQHGDILKFADRIRALSESCGNYPEAPMVCAEAYQVVGSLLSDLGKFDTPEAEKILDNLSQHRLVHTDVLPWPSYEAQQPAAVDALRLWKRAEDSGDYDTQKKALEARDAILAGQQQGATGGDS